MFIKKYEGSVNPVALPGLLNDYKMNLEKKKQLDNLDVFFEIASSETGFSVNDVRKKNRERNRVMVKHVFCYLAKKYTTHTLKSIGDYLGYKDHSSVLHCIQTIKDLMDCDDNIKSHVNNLEKQVDDKSGLYALAYDVIGERAYVYSDDDYTYCV